MAIPGIPFNVILQTGNGQNFISWPIISGATSYTVQRSTDGVSFSTVGTPSVNTYLDAAVTTGTAYYYQISATSTTPTTYASGSILFPGVASDPYAIGGGGNTFSIANTIFTAGTDFVVGPTVADTVNNIIAAVNATASLQRSVIASTFDQVRLTFTAYLPGTDGNGIQLSTTLTDTAATVFSGGTTSVGVSAYGASYPASIVPCSPGQMNLGYIRYLAQLRSDMLNSEFLTTDEWNSNINQSIYELYDILVTKFGDDYFLAPPVTFLTTGARNYPLPDGITTIGGSVPAALYKLIGVDCGVAVGNNAWVTLPRYNWIDRNRFIYPQLQANALGVFNLSYRQMGNSLYFIPNPSAGQYIQLWYVPMMTQLLQDTDMLSFSISGWSELIIVDAAIKALMKEESFEQAQALQAIKGTLLERIETTAASRDVGQPNQVGDAKANLGFYDGGGFGGNGSGMGGW